MVLEQFKQNVEKKIRIVHVEEKIFDKVLRMALGEEGLSANDLAEMVEMGCLADWLQITEVYQQLEHSILAHLNFETCAEVLRLSTERGLIRVANASREMALDCFENVAKSQAFLELSEECMESLLDEDKLSADREENVFEALVRWMRGSKELRGEKLLAKIRYPLLSRDYLAEKVLKMLPGNKLLEELVLETKFLNLSLTTQNLSDANSELLVRALPGNASMRRIGGGVAWGQYLVKWKLGGHKDNVTSLKYSNDRIFSASWDGTICVWNKKTLEIEQKFQTPDNCSRRIASLACCDGLVFSGHWDGSLRTWDLETSECEVVPRLHSACISSLCVGEDWLVSGSHDKQVNISKISGKTILPSERTLTGHGDLVSNLVVWERKVISGSSDLRVWNIESGIQEAFLNDDKVSALIVSGERLYSGSESESSMIYIWALGTWELIHKVQAFPERSDLYPSALAINGVKLIGGAEDLSGDCVRKGMKLWDADNLECLWTLDLGGGIWCMLTVGDDVWTGIGSNVVVWRHQMAADPD